jgi:hypothetical protein
MDAGYVAFLNALQYQQGAVRGKLTEGWTDVSLKGGNLH